MFILLPKNREEGNQIFIINNNNNSDNLVYLQRCLSQVARTLKALHRAQDLRRPADAAALVLATL